MTRKVVITGVGAVTPLGATVESTWAAIKAGRSGIGPITLFDTSEYATRFAGECCDFVATDFMSSKEVRRNDRFIQFAIAAAAMAVENSGLEINDANADRVGVFVGSGMGGLASIEKTHEVIRTRGPGRVSPFFIPETIVNLAAGQISIRHGARYANIGHVSACSSGAHAIGEASLHIRTGRADVMIAGGAESTVTPLGMAGFSSMKALSKRNDDPEGASRPFDAERDGFVVGEGSGILVLESEEHAKGRGATILGTLAGYGCSSDAFHVTTPSPEGVGAARCMKMGLNDAGLAPDAVQYINAHGTSTAYNDKFETMAIKTVFGDHARALAVSSTKSMTGHLLGAAGALEAILSILTLRDQIAPATINLEHPDPDCDLDYVSTGARELPISAVLSNSLGFGGTNASLVFTR